MTDGTQPVVDFVCPKCDFDLRAGPAHGACPECGFTYDKAKLSAQAQPLGAFALLFSLGWPYLFSLLVVPLWVTGSELAYFATILSAAPIVMLGWINSMIMTGMMVTKRFPDPHHPLGFFRKLRSLGPLAVPLFVLTALVPPGLIGLGFLWWILQAT